MVHDIDWVLWSSGLGLLFQLESFGFLGCSIRFKETGGLLKPAYHPNCVAEQKARGLGLGGRGAGQG